MEKKNNISGIYKIRCRSNNKIYIGSSSNIRFRWTLHKSHLNRGVHTNAYLQRAWKLYGSNAFIWKIIEVCPINKLLIREQKWFKKTKCCNKKYGFNIATDASSPGRGHKHSLKTRLKISKSNSGSKHWKSKLTESNIPKIRKLVKDGLSDAKIGKIFNVDRQTIRDIRLGTTWKYVK